MAAKKKTALVEDLEKKVEEVASEPVIIKEPEPVEKNGVVNCSLLNMRAAADPEAQIVAILPKDTKVKIVGDLTDGFYPITYNPFPERPELKHGGFVKEEFLTIE